jgi:hypothetical protein
MLRTLAVATAPVVLTLLAGCSTGGSSSSAPSGQASLRRMPSESSSPSPRAAATTAATSRTPQTTGTKAATTAGLATRRPSAATTPARSTPTPLHGRITGLRGGGSVSVTGLVRNFPLPAGVLPRGHELVLVQVGMTLGGDGLETLSPTRMSLLARGQRASGAFALLGRTEMAAAGYARAPDEVLAGRSGTGWVAFDLDRRGAKDLVLRYTELQIPSFGSKVPVTEKHFDVRLR